MLKKNVFAIAFVVWMVLITFASLYSFNDVDGPKIKIPHFDKFVHFTFYFIACVLGVFFLRERTRGAMKVLKAVLLMTVATVFFGIIIEVIQDVYTAERMGDVYDGLANTIGSFLGALATKSYFSGKRQLKWKY